MQPVNELSVWMSDGGLAASNCSTVALGKDTLYSMSCILYSSSNLLSSSFRISISSESLSPVKLTKKNDGNVLFNLRVRGACFHFWLKSLKFLAARLIIDQNS